MLGFCFLGRGASSLGLLGEGLRAVGLVLAAGDGGFGAGVRPYFENCTVDASILLLCDQVFKGTRWMPWHQEPMKDVGACDMPRGVGNQTLIRGFPNGETWRASWLVAAV